MLTLSSGAMRLNAQALSMSSCSLATVILICQRLNLGRSLELKVAFGSRSALDLELQLGLALELELEQ